jgi:hypothetical protein
MAKVSGMLLKDRLYLDIRALEPVEVISYNRPQGVSSSSRWDYRSGARRVWSASRNVCWLATEPQPFSRTVMG